MRKILLIISLSILPFTCFGASGNCEWLPYSTMGTAADRAAAAAARANPATQRSAALKRTIADRMAKGAEQNKLK